MQLEGVETGDIAPEALSALVDIFSAAYVMRTLEARGERADLIAAAKDVLYENVDKLEAVNVGASIDLALMIGAEMDREIGRLE